MFRGAAKPGSEPAPFGRRDRAAGRTPASVVRGTAPAETAAHRHTPPVSAELAEVTRLLTGIREAHGLSRVELAARIGADAAVIVALEAGDLRHLPVWPETRRIVDQWVAGAGLDPRPALSALAAALEALGKPVDRSSPQAVAEALTQSTRSARRNTANTGDRAGEIPLPRTRGASSPGRLTAAAAPPAISQTATVVERPPRLLRLPLPSTGSVLAAMRMPRPSLARLAVGLPPSRPLRWAAMVVILAALGTSATQTRVVAGALSSLPAPAGDAVRSITDFIAVHFAPVRSGHRWIDVGDPRTRRADKLRIGPHSD